MQKNKLKGYHDDRLMVHKMNHEGQRQARNCLLHQVCDRWQALDSLQQKLLCIMYNGTGRWQSTCQSSELISFLAEKKENQANYMREPKELPPYKSTWSTGDYYDKTSWLAGVSRRASKNKRWRSSRLKKLSMKLATTSSYICFLLTVLYRIN
jgi:hypothetical protein